MAQLIIYWFQFEKNSITISLGLQIGCGVTAFSYSDALEILSTKIFKNIELPQIDSFQDNIDVGTLDQGHVIPNMWFPNVRGIWYPLGYHDYT